MSAGPGTHFSCLQHSPALLLTMQVLDDNPFDRLCNLRRPKEGAAAVAAPSHQTPKRAHAGGGSGSADDENESHRSKRATADAGPAPAGEADAAGAQQQRGGKRVVFDLPPKQEGAAAQGGSDSNGAGASGRGGGGGRGDGGGGRRGGWRGGPPRPGRQGRGVPDHILHPERYTVRRLQLRRA
jgi:uncharacterized membrane protein YgcG